MKRREARAKAVEVLARAGIPSPAERFNHYPHEFSGGMQQRVIIAIAVALNPELLLADEPTTALDITVQAQIIEVMQRLRRDKESAIILITHDLGVVAELCENVAVVYAGNIVEQADLATILEHPAHPYTKGLLASIPRLEGSRGRRLRPIPGVPADPSAYPAGCKFHPRCPRVQPICRQEYPAMIHLGSGQRAACHLHG